MNKNNKIALINSS